MYTHTNRQHNYLTKLHTCMASTIPYQTECQLYRTHLALVYAVATVTGRKFKIGGDSDVTASETSAIACAFVYDFS